MRSVALLLCLAGCGPSPSVEPHTAPTEPAVRQLAGEALGTTWQVKWTESEAGVDHRSAANLVIDRILAEVDAGMSTWRDDSELALVRVGDGPVVVSEDTAMVTRAALDLAAASGGAFDPTVQPLMELWGFHGERRDATPTQAEVDAARAQVDWRRVVIGRSSEGRPTVDSGGTALDLSAIAKGHAVDRVAYGLSDMGIAAHFVEVGGEVRVSGRGASGPLWTVGVELPVPGNKQGQELAFVVSRSNGAVATSGNYRNRYELDGNVVVHTMDPRQGRPIASRVASATVVAPDCRTADGLATALMVMEPQAGLALVRSLPHVEAALLLVQGERFELEMTEGMQRQVRVVSDRVHAARAGAGE
ncbi:MAG: thiamine biosynthesis lipoprotein [Kiritimatiellia bacterium]